MNIFYTIFIFPLSFLMDLVLNSAVLWTGSAGVSIIVLSILVNTVLLPLYYLAERWQNRERNIQRLMAPELTEIKKNYRGEEQYNHTVVLYKEFNYHPIKSLRTSFGFLIQVPFFIAAYTLLSHNPLLDNVSFILLNNLGLPDALISFGGININVMPFVMTVINLFSSLIYAKALTFGEKARLVFVALLFLILLYNSSSGLVFYWTMNNLYSLIKNIIHNPVDFGPTESADKLKK